MHREWLLLAASAVATVLVALGAIRWFAPELLGLPANLRLVAVDERVPPFFDNVFRSEDRRADGFLLVDPVVVTRARPFFPEAAAMGPHDLLGFRNRNVPAVADVVVIGDSQTYGNNAPLEGNWPSRLSEHSNRRFTLYNMSVGGWGAVQYAVMARHAAVFQPRVLVVAFYTGNDPLDSFAVAYGSERWAELRPDPALDARDAPAVDLDPASEGWPVDFPDGVRTVFTPERRLVSNRQHPAVRAGYGVMVNAARRIAEQARSLGTVPLFTIIPTKELVFSRKIAAAGIDAPQVYRTLVGRESENIRALADALAGIEGAVYVDVLAPLQQAALGGVPLYPPDGNGHPLASGYDVIAAALSDAVAARVPEPPRGVLLVQEEQDRLGAYFSDGERAWRVTRPELLAANGWDMSVAYPVVSARDIAALRLAGYADSVDPARFGPAALGE